MGRQLPFLMIGAWLLGAVEAAPRWSVDPREPGPDLPPAGRSLFDHLVSEDGRYQVPFPFAALRRHIEDRLARDAYLDRPLKHVFIPLGRSLQRDASAPDFFASPRIVIATDAEPAHRDGYSGMLLRDRLYIGYLEAADVLEVISYNEAAGRFEFQVVRDYRGGGRREVSYAPRALCTACHQNAAPIFARPLWDETNASVAVSYLLARQDAAAFHGLAVEQGVDVAYAIDNATDRANGFSLTQLLWREGCGAEEPAAYRCRAALLTATLQLSLSGGRQFDAAGLDRFGDWRLTMRRARNSRWPDGLQLPDPDIPNRIPIRGSGSGVDYTGNDIPATFEPLAPRPPLRIWNPDADAWEARAVRGLSDFIARGDIEHLDAWMIEQDVPRRRFEAHCTEHTTDDGGRIRIKLRCDGEGLKLRGRLYVAADGGVSGRIGTLQLLSSELGALTVDGRRVATGRYEFVLVRGAGSGGIRSVRLDDGNALEYLSLERGRDASGSAVLTVRIRQDFALVSEALAQLGEAAADALGHGPFQRAMAMPALFGQLGMPSLAWCCVADDHLPAMSLDTVQAEVEAPELDLFYRFCGQCHRTDAPFPPNFLTGAPARVRVRIAQCGPRIRYRLGMWNLAANRRPKTPMPPQHALAQTGADPAAWADSAALNSLRAAIEGLLSDQDIASEPIDVLLDHDYANLPPCLPTS